MITRAWKYIRDDPLDIYGEGWKILKIKKIQAQLCEKKKKSETIM